MAKKRQSKKNTSVRAPDLSVSDFLLAQVKLHPQDLVRFAMKHFSLTRPAIHRHLGKLIEQGRILKQGDRKTTSYYLPSIEPGLSWQRSLLKNKEEDQIWLEDFVAKVAKYPKNIQDICYFGTTEMINNSIDHSKGKILTLSWQDKGPQIQILVADDGVGIFRKISKSLGIKDYREAVLHLTKGKFTTDTMNHTGQGIFFTSRMFDLFEIRSHDLLYTRVRKEEDWFVETRNENPIAGTQVRMVINKDSKLRSVDIFRRYEDDDFGFDKTDVFVKLAKLEEEVYISRSQARRLLVGLERFSSVILDFSNVRSVGQGFVDEVFRVFKKTQPNIKISCVNMNKDVEFMIRRGLPQN